MVIAIVGFSHSRKEELAKCIAKSQVMPFVRMKHYAKEVHNSQRQMSMEQERWMHLKQSEVFYRSTNVQGNEFITLREQFKTDDNLIYVEDSPATVQNLESLGVPYAVIYLESSKSACLKRVSKMHDNHRAVEARIKFLMPAMQLFKAHKHYSAYVNVVSLDTKQSMQLFADTFLKSVDEWLTHRKPNELHMPLLCERNITLTKDTAVIMP